MKGIIVVSEDKVFSKNTRYCPFFAYKAGIRMEQSNMVKRVNLAIKACSC